jgi:excisionase family DNA binding protein
MKELESSDSGKVLLPGRLGLRPREAARALGIGERTLRQILPEIPHVRVGSAVVIPVDLLREWLRQRAQMEGRKADTVVREVLAELSNEPPSGSGRRGLG